MESPVSASSNREEAILGTYHIPGSPFYIGTDSKNFTIFRLHTQEKSQKGEPLEQPVYRLVAEAYFGTIPAALSFLNSEILRERMSHPQQGRELRTLVDDFKQVTDLVSVAHDEMINYLNQGKGKAWSQFQTPKCEKPVSSSKRRASQKRLGAAS